MTENPEIPLPDDYDRSHNNYIETTFFIEPDTLKNEYKFTNELKTIYSNLFDRKNKKIEYFNALKNPNDYSLDILEPNNREIDNFILNNFERIFEPEPSPRFSRLEELRFDDLRNSVNNRQPQPSLDDLIRRYSNIENTRLPEIDLTDFRISERRQRPLIDLPEPSNSERSLGQLIDLPNPDSITQRRKPGHFYSRESGLLATASIPYTDEISKYTIDGNSIVLDEKEYTRVDFTPDSKTKFTQSKMTEYLSRGITGMLELLHAIDNGEVELPPIFIGSTNINMAVITQRLGFKLIDSCLTDEGKVKKDLPKYVVVGRLEDIRAKVAEYAGSERMQRVMERSQRLKNGTTSKVQ